MTTVVHDDSRSGPGRARQALAGSGRMAYRPRSRRREEMTRCRTAMTSCALMGTNAARECGKHMSDRYLGFSGTDRAGSGHT